MNELPESEEIYFEENQPEVEIDQTADHPDTSKKQLRYASCIIAREISSTAPSQTHHHTRKLKLLIKDQETSQGQKGVKLQVKRKMTYGSPYELKNQSSNYKSTHKQSSFRTAYSNNKHSIPLESISPDSFQKIERKSESPNRKNLYWQSWLLEGKQTKFSKNFSGLYSKTLKIDKQPLPNISASSYLAIFSDNHEIIAQKNQHQRREIASLTKIMTAYTVIDICNTYGVKIRQHKITIHQQASWMEGTSANLRIDEEFLIIDLLYGLLLPSGNDAGVALAQYFGKFLSFKFTKDNDINNRYSSSMQKFLTFKNFYDSEYHKESIKLFVFEMNKNSHKIGLKNTHFANPTGLSNSKNYSTAYDMAMLTCHCLKNLLMRQIFKKKVYTCETTNEKLSYSRQVQWKNTNKHLYQFRECIGAKTGITPTAGPCLSSVYKVMSREIIVVVLNCASIDERYEDAKNIYKWCRKNMKIHQRA